MEALQERRRFHDESRPPGSAFRSIYSAIKTMSRPRNHFVCHIQTTRAENVHILHQVHSVWGQIKHLLFPMLCLVGQHTSPLLPFVAPNLPHKPPLCCQLLLHPQIKSAHYCPLYKCAHKQTHTTAASETLLHPHIEVHTDTYHLTVCSIRFAALYGFRGEAIEAT